MQYWIFYSAGVGGDGFGCMLEHATNVYPADGIQEWRIHHYEDTAGTNPTRFYQAHWASEPKPFRYPFLPEKTVLSPVYESLIEQGKNTVITLHYIYFMQIDQFEHRDIVTKDQIKINLYSDRAVRIWEDLRAKRNVTFNQSDFVNFHQKENNFEKNRPDYDIHIDIEKIWRSWDYTQECMKQLNIDLSKEVYDHYLTYIDLRD